MQVTLSRFLAAAIAAVATFVGVVRESGAEQTFTNWNGYEQRNFVVDGRNALLVLPKQPAAEKPWIWRTEFFGHEPQADLALLGRGFHVGYVDVSNMYGAPVALDRMDKFYEQVVQEFGLSPQVVLEGFSRGGLFALNWAARHPDRVACIYNDAPVCDFKSWPGGRGRSPGSPGDWQTLLKVYGLNEEQALAYQENPVDNLAPLISAGVPLLHVCGECDEAVPIEENTRRVEARYRQSGGPMSVISKAGIGHHPHSLVNPTPIVAFVLKHTIGNPPPALFLEGLSDYQVLQRATAAGGVVPLRGFAIYPVGELQYQVQSPNRGGDDDAGWQTIAVDPLTNRFDTQVSLPAGGWYRVALRIQHADATLAEQVIQHLGLGEVFVVAGQSNSANHGSERQTAFSGMVTASDGIKWRLAYDPQPGASGDGGSFMPAFGDAMFARYNVPVGVVAIGEGATSVREWLPRGTRIGNEPTTGGHMKSVGDRQWECTGELFDRLTSRLHTLGPNGCRAVLWHQGESDAGQARAGYPAERQITGDQYRDFMATLIRASRKSVGWDLPWFVAQATYHSAADAADKEFRAAQKSLWMEGLAVEGPDTDALQEEYRDGVHFNRKGLQAHGNAWAEKVGIWLDDKL